MEGANNSGIVGEMFESVIRRIDNFNTRPISAAMDGAWGMIIIKTSFVFLQCSRMLIFAQVIH